MNSEALRNVWTQRWQETLPLSKSFLLTLLSYTMEPLIRTNTSECRFTLVRLRILKAAALKFNLWPVLLRSVYIIKRGAYFTGINKTTQGSSFGVHAVTFKLHLWAEVPWRRRSALALILLSTSNAALPTFSSSLRLREWSRVFLSSKSHHFLQEGRVDSCEEELGRRLSARLSNSNKNTRVSKAFFGQYFSQNVKWGQVFKKTISDIQRCLCRKSPAIQYVSSCWMNNSVHKVWVIHWL